MQRADQCVDARRRRRRHHEDGKIRLADAARAVPDDHALVALHELPQAVALNFAKTERVELALPRQLLGCIIHAWPTGHMRGHD